MKLNYTKEYYKQYKINDLIINQLSSNHFNDQSYHNDANPSFNKENFVLWADLTNNGDYRDWYDDKNVYICVSRYDLKPEDDEILDFNNYIDGSDQYFDTILDAINYINNYLTTNKLRN